MLHGATLHLQNTECNQFNSYLLIRASTCSVHSLNKSKRPEDFVKFAILNTEFNIAKDMNSTSVIFTFLALFTFNSSAWAQKWVSGNDSSRVNRSMFRPLEDAPTPNEFRSASGKPGYRYWQQRVDYDIKTSLDTVEHKVIGSERITYYNNSPDELNFLWIQLDQNLNSIQHSRTYASRPALPPKISERFRQFIDVTNFDGGHQISRVQLVDAKGKLVDAKTYINGTVMRVNLLQPLKPKEKVQLEIDWSYRVPDNGRGAKELVRDGWLYEIAQWFPRLCVYDDVNGWQTDQYLGTGEFYLNFGNYNVEITVPWNHIVQATGVLQIQTKCSPLSNNADSKKPSNLKPRATSSNPKK
jgi:hypothetical protein